MESTKLDASSLIAAAFLHLQEEDRQVCRQLGLTLHQFWVVIHLGSSEGLPPSTLAHLIILDKNSMTHIVDSLEAKSLVQRRYGKNGDRRFQRIVLTEQGRKLRETILSARNERASFYTHALGEEDLSCLHRSLNKLLQILA